MDGVVLDPSAFSITFAFLPSMTATHEFVVPRSIPMTSLEYARMCANALCAIDGTRYLCDDVVVTFAAL